MVSVSVRFTVTTLDAIHALRLLSELHTKFTRPLHMAYVVIKTALDSVDRLYGKRSEGNVYQTQC